MPARARRAEAIAGRDSPIGRSLAVAGQTGTLRKRMLDSTATGRVHAKTGTLNEVNALAGFADTPAGSPITFLMIQNGSQSGGPTWVDRYAELLMGYRRRAPPRRARTAPSDALGPRRRPGSTVSLVSSGRDADVPARRRPAPGDAAPAAHLRAALPELVSTASTGQPEFGVVLIERGSEVGGGDVRTEVGTVARIVEAGRFDRRRWALGTVGVRRIRSSAGSPTTPIRSRGRGLAGGAGGRRRRRTASRSISAFRRLLALAAELGSAGVSGHRRVWSTTPPSPCYQMTAGAPLGPADRQSILLGRPTRGPVGPLGRAARGPGRVAPGPAGDGGSDDGFDEGLDEL